MCGSAQTCRTPIPNVLHMNALTTTHELIRRTAVFAQLSDDRTEALARAAQQRRYQRASTILAAGKRAEGVYIMVSGRAKAILADGQGRAMTLSIFEPGDFFGDMGLNEPCEADLAFETLQACEVLYVPTAAFRAGIEGNYEAAMLIARSVQSQLCKAQRKIASLGLVDVYGRVARLMVESARQVDGEWLVETGSEEIARTVAASREMVSRVVRKLMDQGFVRRVKRKTVIVDWHSMSAACSA